LYFVLTTQQKVFVTTLLIMPSAQRNLLKIT